jgi:hypothetical protein
MCTKAIQKAVFESQYKSTSFFFTVCRLQSLHPCYSEMPLNVINQKVDFRIEHEFNVEIV